MKTFDFSVGQKAFKAASKVDEMRIEEAEECSLEARGAIYAK